MPNTGPIERTHANLSRVEEDWGHAIMRVAHILRSTSSDIETLAAEPGADLERVAMKTVHMVLDMLPRLGLHDLYERAVEVGDAKERVREAQQSLADEVAPVVPVENPPPKSKEA